MEETFPVRLDGEDRGSLTVRRDGLATVFEARCADPGRLVRLAVYGPGGEGYLGVMAPENGELRLRRRLTRAALSDFPGVIEYAGEAGAGKSPAPAPSPAAARTPEPPPGPAARQGEDLLWYRAGDGSLFTTWQARQFRAIPMAAWGLPVDKMLEKRTIEGVEYAVFETKAGKITG